MPGMSKMMPGSESVRGAGKASWYLSIFFASVDEGEIVMRLSQDPSDFDGQAGNVTTQLGTVIAFAYEQSQRGLPSLQGAFGRRLQPCEFAATFLPPGVAFAKLSGREPERIMCWDSLGRVAASQVNV